MDDLRTPADLSRELGIGQRLPEYFDAIGRVWVSQGTTLT